MNDTDMKITYNGPSEAVQVPKAGKVFKRGEAQECPQAIAEKLIAEQPASWAEVKTITNTTKKA
jgi:hypothetical protein